MCNCKRYVALKVTANRLVVFNNPPLAIVVSDMILDDVFSDISNNFFPAHRLTVVEQFHGELATTQARLL